MAGMDLSGLSRAAAMRGRMAVQLPASIDQLLIAGGQLKRRGSIGTSWKVGRRRVEHLTSGSPEPHFKYPPNQARVRSSRCPAPIAAPPERPILTSCRTGLPQPQWAAI